MDMGNVLTEIWKKKKRKKERKKETKDIIEPQHTHCQVDICCFFIRQTMNKLPTNDSFWTRFWFFQMINRDHIQVFQVTVQVYSPCFFIVALPPKNFLRGWSVSPHKVILDFSTLSYYSTIHKKCLTWCTNDSFWFCSLLCLTDRSSYSPSWL